MTPPEADVALVLEGTYPYAIGGVSTWADGLVRGLPDVRFGVAHLYAGEPPRGAAYALPANVVWHVDLQLPERLDAVDPGAVAAAVPPHRLAHALSTGFAGLVGAALKRGRGVPLVVTEHGVAWREIERGAPELETGLRLVGRDVSGGNPCASRAGWTRLFQDYARTAYAAADHVTTVTAANLPHQRALGHTGTEVIPNGVPAPEAVGPLTGAERGRLDGSARLPASARVGLVGRVTPLKDIHAFVRAAAAVLREHPGGRFYVVGPTDDRPYAASCRALADRLGVGDRVHLTGAQPAALWHRHLDVVALTSRSEAEPLALLEAMAHRTPTVAPDVGGCRDLLTGGDAPPGGLVVDPEAEGGTARAIGRLLASGALRDRLARGGEIRAARRSAAAVARRYGAVYTRLGAADGTEVGERARSISGR